MVDFELFLSNVTTYEDPDKLDAALDVLPLETLFAEAEAMADSGLSEEDRVVKALLKWFKTWFKWVNALPCEFCGFEKTEGPVPTKPNDADILYNANVVELWHCSQCQKDSRFPRYNDPIKLLETRKGRCGEWCNVMHLMLRALGRDVRFIWNSEDHVWNEIWSSRANRWIHIDSCEAAFDNPLIYADGWGKKMAYVIGFSLGGVRDVTKRYVRRPDAALPRQLIGEGQLDILLTQLTSDRRANFDPVDLVEWYERDESETRELADLSATPATNEPLPPRQSGSAEWTQSRGEAGDVTSD